jgi:hypothetical protein
MNRKVIAENKNFRRGLGLGMLFGLLFGIGGSNLFWFCHNADSPAVITTPEKSENQEEQPVENSLTSHKIETPTNPDNIGSAHDGYNDKNSSEQETAPDPMPAPLAQATPADQADTAPAAPSRPRDTYETLRQNFDAQIDLYLRRLANSASYNNADVSKYRDILYTDQTLDDYLDNCVNNGLYKNKIEALRALEKEILTIINE